MHHAIDRSSVTIHIVRVMLTLDQALLYCLVGQSLGPNNLGGCLRAGGRGLQLSIIEYKSVVLYVVLPLD